MLADGGQPCCTDEPVALHGETQSQQQLRTGSGFHRRAGNYLEKGFFPTSFFQKHLHDINLSVQLLFPLAENQTDIYSGHTPRWPVAATASAGATSPHYQGAVSTAETLPRHLPSAEVPHLLDSYKYITVYMRHILSTYIYNNNKEKLK